MTTEEDYRKNAVFLITFINVSFIYTYVKIIYSMKSFSVLSFIITLI